MRMPTKKEIIAQAKSIDIDIANPSCYIYFLLDKEEIVYVGSTARGHMRLISHIVTCKQLAKKDYTAAYIKSARIKKFDAYFCFQCTVEQRYELEADYIIMFAPKYNATIPRCKKYITPIEAKMRYKISNKTFQYITRSNKLRPFIHGHSTLFKRIQFECAYQKYQVSKTA